MRYTKRNPQFHVADSQTHYSVPLIIPSSLPVKLPQETACTFHETEIGCLSITSAKDQMPWVYNQHNFFVLCGESKAEPGVFVCLDSKNEFLPRCAGPDRSFIYPSNVKRFLSRQDAIHFIEHELSAADCQYTGFTIRLASPRWVEPAGVRDEDLERPTVDLL